jgi:AcrR family transcriptional regulator
MDESRDEARRAAREAAEEIRRQAHRAGAEIRLEIGEVDEELRRSVREAIDEVRSALREAFGASAEEEASTPGAATRLSRAERKELTRELLLDAAIEVFARKGYHGASLDDVAEAAGFTKGAVYSNFPRKSDLFRELVERESSRRGAVLRTAVEAVDVSLLPELAAEWLSRQSGESRDWDVLTVEFWLAAVRDPAIQRALREGRETALTELGDVLDRRISAAGGHPGLSGRELAVVLDALGTGLLMAQYLEPESGSPDLFARVVRKLLADVTPADGPAPDVLEDVPGM